MNAAEHYLIAEQILENAAIPQRVPLAVNPSADPISIAAVILYEPHESTNEPELVARAHVHATLAFVAALRPSIPADAARIRSTQPTVHSDGENDDA